MRTIINLVEGRNSVPVDPAGLTAQIKTTAGQLAKTFQLQWDNALINDLGEASKKFQQRLALDNSREDDTANHVQFDAREFFRDNVDDVAKRALAHLTIARDCREYEMDYQNRMARSDRPDDQVEDSDVLRFVKAQSDFGGVLEQFVPTQLATYSGLNRALERLIEVRSRQIQDDELVLLDDVRTAVSKVVPLMLMGLRFV